MPTLFVSYRRSDVPGHAGRIFDRLTERFGKSSVFMDVGSLELGADFVEVIEATVSRSDVLIAVIGPSWLSPDEGRRRLDDPNDWVRLELLQALERDIRVVPVLVHGARMPDAADLPAELRPLARKHGIPLTEAAWNAQLDYLITRLEAVLPSAPTCGDPDLPSPGLSTEGLNGTPVPDWSLGRVEAVARFEHGGAVDAAIFSSDGRRLATRSDDQTARVWDVATGKELVRLHHPDVIGKLAYSADGRYLATGCGGTALVHDLATGRDVLRLDRMELVFVVAFASSRPYVAISGFGEGDRNLPLRVFDLRDGTEVLRSQNPGVVYAAEFSPDSLEIFTLSAPGTFRLWDLSAGQEISRFDDEKLMHFEISGGWRDIAVIGQTRDARVWNMRNGEQRSCLRHEAEVATVAGSSDGRLIATASGLTARLWTPDGRDITPLLHDEEVSWVGFTPDAGHLISLTSEGTVHIWSVHSGKEVRRLANCCILGLSSIGDYLATGDDRDTIAVHRVSSVAEAARFQHSGLTDLDFSPDSTQIATVGTDGTARIWRVAPGS